MSSISLKNLTLTVFGESHGYGVGGVITGLPAGCKIDFVRLREDMDRRRPGQNKTSTPRKENDDYTVVSGLMEDFTTGAPLCIMIKNTNTHSEDYIKLKDVPRPSHADYPAWVKYGGFNDPRGGGHFSGRLTAPLVCLGGICKQILNQMGVQVRAAISNVGDILNDTTDGSPSEAIIKLIEKHRSEGDSVGGSVQCTVTGVPAGKGGPLFEGAEGMLSQLLFGIPAVKGVEFGLGFGFTVSSGSEVNDRYRIEDGAVVTTTNNNGGITGGITNGMPVTVRVAFKPTPSIFKPQQSVDLSSMTNTELQIKGRHDPCIVLRAVPVVEAVMSFGILDLVL